MSTAAELEIAITRFVTITEPNAFNLVNGANDETVTINGEEVPTFSKSILDFQTSGTNEIDTFTSNSGNAILAFNDDATAAISDFNDNATAAISDFNDNATAAISDFNDDATAALSVFEGVVENSIAGLDFVTTTTHNLDSGDLRRTQRASNVAGCAFTIPLDATLPVAIGDFFTIRRAIGAGALSWNNDVAITINNNSIGAIAEGQTFVIQNVGVNTWDFI